MNHFFETTAFQKPLITKTVSSRSSLNAFIGLIVLTFVVFSFTNCRNQDKNAATTSQVAAQTPSTATAATDKSADQLKTAQAPQSPLHKLLDSLNVAGQPQWKLRYLDSVAQKNKNITMPQLRRIFDSLGHVKRGFIKK